MRSAFLSLVIVCSFGIRLISCRTAQARDVRRQRASSTSSTARRSTGWKVSPKTGHSRASKNKSGGKWVVKDGAIVGSQDIPGNGGIIITEKEYGDFEVVLEMNNDFGPDSGLFLRRTDTGKCYQAMIDYHANGNLMGIYGEGLPGGKPNVLNFNFKTKVTDIEVKDYKPFPCPVTAADWPKFWKHGEWNELRAASRATRRSSRPGSRA